ncbi:MAG: phospholipid carrier-dependent glycosyltransferase [bacterium]|nr:phospholipid carrier-dependent glycosyltransferase [bacterium]
MKSFFNKNWLLLILIVLAIFTRFWQLDKPSEVVFDEVHFGKFVSAYFNHEYYFDIHPPLGKLMIAGTAKFLGFNSGFDFKQIGEALNAKDLFALRFLPAFFGVIFVIVIYQLLLALNLSRLGAFAGAFLVIFENAILVESRFILVDIFLLTFGFSGIYTFLLFRKSNGKSRLFYLLLTGVLLGLAFSIKSTGISFLGLALLFTFVDSLYKFELKKFNFGSLLFSLKNYVINFEYKKFILTSLGLIIISVAVYASTFPMHFAQLYNSGPGDAYMSAGFQKTLVGNKVSADNTERPLNYWGKFIELNKAMFNYNSGLTATHPDGSKWYEWPLMKKPIYYWVKSGDGVTSNIYLVGNPLVWWLGTFSVLLALLSLLLKKIRQKLTPEIYFLIAGYVINLLPFILISRVAFLYHYLTALVFSILILVFMAEKLLFNNQLKIMDEEIEKQNFKNHKRFFTIYFICLSLVFISFLVLSPLTYGLPTSSEQAKSYSSFIGSLHN